MMLALAWLTVCLPIVNKAHEQVDQHSSTQSGHMAHGNEEECDNPFATNTEEKTSANSFSEEYLHDNHVAEHYRTGLSVAYKIEHCATYVAFYGELISPPPDTV